MYVRVLTLSILLGAFSWAAERTTEVEENIDIPAAQYSLMVQEIAEFLTTYIESENCWKRHKELTNVTMQAMQCMFEAQETGTWCKAFKDNYEQCAAPVVQIATECSDADQKDMPQLSVNVAKNLAEYVCTNEGSQIFEIFHPCIFKSFFRKYKCFENLPFFSISLSKQPNQKDAFCESFVLAKKCVFSEITSNCAVQKTIDSFTGLFDSLGTKPCEAFNNRVQN